MGNLRAWNNLEGITLRSVSLRRQRLAEEPVWCGPWAAQPSPSDLKTSPESKSKSIATPPKSSQAKGATAGD
jgi:hypothetical protein